MLFLLGLLLTVAGFGAAALMVGDLIPAATDLLAKLPGGPLTAVLVGFAGVFLMMLGRRPAD